MATPLLVVQTYEVSPRGGPNYFEIHLAADAGVDANRTIVYTWDAAIYARALRAEGGKDRVTAEYRRVQLGKRWVKVLDTLEVKEGEP